jgi:hypothetical protein
MNYSKNNKRIGEQYRLRIKMTGPKVGEAKLSASDFAEIIKRTQQAVKRVGQVLYGQESGGRGRKKKDIEDLCEFFLVAWEKGSAEAILELAQPPAQLNLFGYIGEESLKIFLTGMESISQGSLEQSKLPSGFDMGVLQACNALSKVLDHGIDEITFHSENGKPAEFTAFTKKTRDCLNQLLGEPIDLGHFLKVGRLEVISGHGGLTGRLREADGTRWTCHFKEDHIDILPETWMHNVKMSGRAIVEEGKENIFEVDSILITDEKIGEGSDVIGGQSFWKSIPLEELMEKQLVSPTDDLDEISSLWPADDNPDDLFQYVLSERVNRRTLSQGNEKGQ